MKYKVEWCEEDDKSSCKDKNVDGTKVVLKELESGKEYDVTVTPINPLGELGKPLKLKFETADKDSKSFYTITVVNPPICSIWMQLFSINFGII